MSNVFDLLRTDFQHLENIEALQHSPEILLGVTPEAIRVLKDINIQSVFDLASSRIFANATILTKAAAENNNPFARVGTPPRDMVIATQVADKRISELQFAAVGVLEGIGPDKQANVQTGLSVRTVRDLALYPPYLAAIQLLNSTFFPQNDSNFDPESPSDLVPKAGEYPTERVQYRTLLLDSIADDTPAVDINSAAFKPINLTSALKSNSGFKKIANGALLTFTQSWFVQGLTLGQLLHSTALAPGESTRMVVIDWSRRDSGRQSEQISEKEDLTNDTSHNRSISEVTQAVATEAQQGFSQTKTVGSTVQGGGSAGLDLGIVSFGGSAAASSNSSEATSFSSSSGRRDIAASMSQQVNDRTHQHAHATRSRRASVVREVAQSEHEAVSSRVITNYNHMHALTIQYFEVVQVYRVEVQLTDAQRVIFIPMELIDFNENEIVSRFRSVLARVALTAEIRDLLRNFDVIEIRPSTQTGFKIRNAAIFVRPTLFQSAVLDANAAAVIASGASGSASNPATAGTGTLSTAGSAASSGGFGNVLSSLSTRPPAAFVSQLATEAVSAIFVPPNASDTVRDNFWSAAQLSRLSNLLERNIFRPRSSSLFLPSETVLVEANLAAANDTKFAVEFIAKDGRRLSQLPQPMALADLASIVIKGTSPADQEVSIVFTLSKNGVLFPLHFPPVVVPKNTPETTVLEFINAGINANLRSHLIENRQHYSQAIFRALSSTEIAAILSGFSLKIGDRNVPVVQLIDPKPVGYVGNYVAFSIATDNTGAGEDRAWNDFKKNRGIEFGKIHADIIPLSSGGVFAEAVLGRSNSAEKLDITRFWNWQDSPIPIQPTEIAAIQTGSRARDFDTTPGQLSNPIVNITNPTNLPDPAGMAAILGAIQNGNTFRDMSGLAQTAALAQAALQTSAASASTAGSQAVQAQTVHLQAQVEKLKIVADLIAKLKTGGAAGGSSSGSSIGKNPSTDGSLINFFDKQAGQSVSTDKAESTFTPSTGTSSGTPANDSRGNTTSEDGNTNNTRSRAGNPAANAAVFGALGEPAGGILDRVSASQPVGVGGGGTPIIETVTKKMDLPDAPKVHQKVSFTRTTNTTTNVSKFTASNNSHDVVELVFTLNLTNMLVTPANASGAVFVLPPQTQDIDLFEINPDDPTQGTAFKFQAKLFIGDRKAIRTNPNDYVLPFLSGKTFKCVQGFDGSLPAGTTSGATHTDAFNKFSVDLALPNNSVVCAARGGVVVDFDASRPNKPGPKANFVRILHDDGTYGIYLHLTKGGVSVALGQTVLAGDVIGKSGNSGQSSGPHLHFAVLANDNGALNSTQWGFAIDAGSDPVAGKDYTRP